jgi:DNA-directed RNA polymerase subunit beta'
MPAYTSVGHFLINDVLPESHRISGPITNKGLHDHVVGLAKTNPAEYVRVISALKRRGDEIATLEGVSVGLDDIAPEYAARDAILTPALKRLNTNLSAKDREALVVETQDKLLDYTKRHGGSMTHMALSGARGNPGQLMKIVATPLATVNPKKGIDRISIEHSYSEGLSPAEYWVSVPEVRANEVQARISVSEPGEMAKVLVANMIGHTVTATDCGTMNGIRILVGDGHALDRFSQAGSGLSRNTLITPRVIQDLSTKGVRDIQVRSPMTCSAQHGVCQFCQGHSEKGQIHQIGAAVGVRAAQALAEPLTQMALSARHGTLTVKATKLEAVGLKGVRQLLEIPKAFKFEAVLAPQAGLVSSVEAAPQGGHYIHIGAHKLYAQPNLTITQPVGSHVEEGDALTDGVPNPARVVAAKGIGAGRAYFVDALHRVYQNEGLNIDRRHLELLAKSEMNHVRFIEADAHHPEFLKGDVVNYNAFREAYAKDVARVPVDQAVGSRLGQEVLHHTVGTPVTPGLVKELKSRGVKEVLINKRLPQVEFVMKPFTMNPLLESDWMARLSHRYLKGSIHQAVHFGETSDIHGAHPVPAYAYGAELRHGPSGTY